MLLALGTMLEELLLLFIFNYFTVEVLIMLTNTLWSIGEFLPWNCFL